MYSGFYHHRSITPTFELGQVETVDVNGRTETDLANIRVSDGDRVSVRGSALDTSTALPANDIRFSIDGGPLQKARTGIRDRTLSIVFNDQLLANGGFEFEVETNGLKPGPHFVAISAVEPRAPAGLPIQTIRLFVAPSAGGER